MGTFLLYFVVGLVYDVILTIDTKAVAAGNGPLSAVCSFIATIFSVFVIANIVLSGEILIPTLGYAFGGSLGAYWAVKHTHVHTHVHSQKNRRQV